MSIKVEYGLGMYSLHDHSDFSDASRSFPDSSMKLKEMIVKAKEKGLKGIAITDHEFVGSYVRAKQIEEELDFPVILGNEIYAVTDQQYDLLKDKYVNTMYYPHFLMLALDKVGAFQLMKLSTIAWTENGFQQKGLFRTPTKFSDIEEVIAENRGHIVCSSACLGGQISKWIKSYLDNPEQKNFRMGQIKRFVDKCKYIFGEGNFFIELQPPLNKDHLQHITNLELIKIAKITNTETIITTDAHYYGKELLDLHLKFLNSSKDNDEDSFEKDKIQIYGTAYLMSEKEVREYFKDDSYDENVINNSIENTVKIGNRAERYNFKRKQVVPKIEYEENKLKLDFFPNRGIFKEILNSDNDDNKYLLYRIQEGIERKNTPKDKLDKTFDRVELELTEILEVSKIIQDNLGTYFTTMEVLIDIIWNEGDSIVGVGRGSCSSSIICFLLEIIQINPIDMPVEMPFWRFISKERPELPDCYYIIILLY